jgi:hypothetical protein
MGQADNHLLVNYTRTTGKRVVRQEAWAWRFPYCSTCLAHVKAAAFVRLVARIAGIGIFAGCVWLFHFSNGVSLTTVGLAAILGVLVGAIAHLLLSSQFVHRTSSCACSDSAVRFINVYGSVSTLHFANPDFAEKLTQANPKKVLQGGRIRMFKS